MVFDKRAIINYILFNPPGYIELTLAVLQQMLSFYLFSTKI